MSCFIMRCNSHKHLLHVVTHCRSPGAPPATCTQPKRTCRLMASCAEAAHYFECGMKELDGDGNGVPCEILCMRQPASKDITQRKKDMCDRIRRAPEFMSEGRMSHGLMPAVCLA